MKVGSVEHFNILVSSCIKLGIMKVERKGSEILVRLSLGANAARIQSMLDYLRYEELTSKSEATDDDVAALTEKAKKGRWKRTKEELGWDD